MHDPFTMFARHRREPCVGVAQTQKRRGIRPHQLLRLPLQAIAAAEESERVPPVAERAFYSQKPSLRKPKTTRGPPRTRVGEVDVW